MKYLIITLLGFYCSQRPKVKIVKVDRIACVNACAHNYWTGGVYIEKIPGCQKLYESKICCAFQFIDSGADINMSWHEGEVGATTTCPPEVK